MRKGYWPSSRREENEQEKLENQNEDEAASEEPPRRPSTQSSMAGEIRTPLPSPLTLATSFAYLRERVKLLTCE
eukprot:2702615-Rhodomonas_salina.1